MSKDDYAHKLAGQGSKKGLDVRSGLQAVQGFLC